jgi:predicted ATPase/transcriptional regulator with XRE-family HTH domain
MDEPCSFGVWLRRRRKALDLTQEALARRVSYSISTIRKLEAGEYRPSGEIAERLADALEVAPEQHAAFVQFARVGRDADDIGLNALAVSTPTPPTLVRVLPAVPLAIPSGAPRTNLPPQPTPFIGRADELGLIARHLTNPDCRFVTLIGPGGIGKTRLAIEAASARITDFPDGVYLVALATIDSVSRLASVIGNALTLPLYDETDREAQLIHFLRAKRLLLLLDNFEHLLEGSSLLARILDQAPGVKLLVTSRERLNLLEEWLLPLQGLRFPKDDLASDEVTDYSAVQLFVQRAQQVQPAFALSAAVQPAVLRICRLLEGMPLGIELAAAWTRLLPCAEIAAEITNNLDFLATTARNVPARQRSLRAAFEHSWELLSGAERQVFARLAVFRGGFTRAAAEAICGTSSIETGSGEQDASFFVLHTLSSLVDKSLLYVQPSGRYDLHEALRQYAQEKLQMASESRPVHAQHCSYYMALLRYQSQDELVGRLKEVLATVNADIENVRAAWQWAIVYGAPEDLRIWLDGIFHLYEARSLFREGAESCEQLADRLRRTGETARPVMGRDPQRDSVVGHALTVAGWFYITLGLFDKARERAYESAPWLRSPSAQLERANNLLLLGTVGALCGPHLEAKQLLSESLALNRESGPRLVRAYALVDLGIACTALGEYVEARQHLLESLSILQDIGHLMGIGYCLLCLGDVARALGDYTEARWRYMESLAIRSEISSRWGMAVSHTRLGSLARTLGDYVDAQQHYQESLDICTALHHVKGRAIALGNLGRVAFAQCELAEAKALHQESLALSRDIDDRRGIVLSLNYLGQISYAAGEYREVRQSFDEALKTSLQISAVPLALDVLVGLAELVAREGNQARAVELLVLVLQHPAGEKRTKDRAGRLLGNLTSQLPPEEISAAQERAKERNLDQSMEEVFGFASTTPGSDVAESPVVLHNHPPTTIA